MFLGFIFVIIGVTFLLKNLGYISQDAWDVIWPAMLIIVGIWILLRGRSECFFWKETFGRRKKEEE